MNEKNASGQSPAPAEDLVPLTQVAAALRNLAGGNPPSYRQLWHAIADGKIPAELVNGRHWVRRADLPRVAIEMGMTVPAVQRKRQQIKSAEYAV
jgi:hypothetical protein